MNTSVDRLDDTVAAARAALLARRTQRGCFVGELSSSALSTATAAMAFAMFDPSHAQAHAGWQWLCRNQNEDGGWGDTIASPTNISTTTLCWSSLGLHPEPDAAVRDAIERSTAWLTRECGDLGPERLATTIRARYGADQTFSVPILTTCALAGRIDWKLVPQLPFELASCPTSWFRALNLRVVSYALPALIAIGQVRHHHRPSWNPIARCARALTKRRTLRILRAIQPATGGYLEAAPLTSFVVMSLISMGRRDHPVVAHGLEFLAETVREDGSWPIDTNLDTWTTTLSVQALGGLAVEEQEATRRWLLDQQLAAVHPYTQAAPGGWAWTDRAGGVPDADDTAGAILALRQISSDVDAAARGITWLLDLRNGDGGIPTFCRGWGKLPFDRSGSDLTAHVLRAMTVWREELPAALQSRCVREQGRLVDYLLKEQRPDGAWIPLWFGNQHEATHENPIYGTSRVLRAVASVRGHRDADWADAGRRGVEFLTGCQRVDGGFGIVPTVEETALAVEALAAWVLERDPNAADLRAAVRRGVEWLIDATAGGTRFSAAPIGLYFARLWYSEELYPMIFSVNAFEMARRCLAQTEASCPSR